jgi:hypothetical protein
MEEINNDIEKLYPCPVCNGVSQDINVDNIKFTNTVCDFCWGKKNLTWLEMVFGIDRDYFIDRLEAAFRAASVLSRNKNE